MVFRFVILRDALIGVGNIVFKFPKRFALAEHPGNFLKFANEPAIVFPELKGKFVFHSGCLLKVSRCKNTTFGIIRLGTRLAARSGLRHSLAPHFPAPNISKSSGYFRALNGTKKTCSRRSLLSMPNVELSGGKNAQDLWRPA
jgi:hypothetical protein